MELFEQKLSHEKFYENFVSHTAITKELKLRSKVEIADTP